MNKNNQQGFTLVELSIVLVIIGLLIGGILAAQSMINTTKIQSFTRQIGQFDAAVVNFQDKYGALPGDSARFNSAVGDSDGLIDSGITTTAPTAATYVGETANVWLQLNLSGLKREEGTSNYGTSYVVGTDFPRAKVGTNTTGIIIFGESASTLLGTTITANAYIVADCSEMVSTTLDCKSGLSGADAIAIDNKLDDGIGTTGSTRGFDGADVVTWAGLIDATAAAYTAGTSQDANILGIRIGTQTGNPQ